MTAVLLTPGPDSTQPHQVALKVVSLSKSFGATRALRDASFELRAGEVHALVGENGSGKSTLVKLISGVYTPDSGTIEVGADALRSLTSPKIAQQRGIATVFQEVLVAENMSVLDNLWAGADGLFHTRVPLKTKRELAAACLGQLMATPPPLDAPLGSLALSDRQACGIARAILRKPRVLVLDEATSSLDFDTRNRLFAMIAQLTATGVAVVLISHRMDEIDEIGDRLTVMRSGESVATLARGEWNPQELVRLMTGADHLVQSSTTERIVDGNPEQVVLSTRDLTLVPGGSGISVELKRGELIGLAGLEGHGQDQFLQALCGGHFVSGTVARVVDGIPAPVVSRRGATRQGIAYVPRERGLEAGFSWMSVVENFAMPTIARDSRGGWFRRSRSEKRLHPLIDQLRIKLGRSSDAITTLSGGNQQKIMISRWLAAEPSILLLNDPTRGIDVNAKRDLYTLFAALTRAGMTIVMLSTEVDEHVELMDRVLVFREHQLFAEIPRAELSRERLVGAFFGGEREADSVTTGR